MDKRNITSSIFFILLAAFVLLNSLSMGIGSFSNPQPGFLLFTTSLLLMATCVMLFAANFYHRNTEINLAGLWTNLNWHKNIIVLFSLIVYTTAVPIIGYISATFALMAVLFGLGETKTWTIIVSSLLAVFLSYGLFQYLLKIPLPRSVWAF